MTALWWFIVSLALMVVEMVTPGLFFFACLGVGALVAAITVWLGLDPSASWFVFFGSSTLLVLVVAPLARRWTRRVPGTPVGLDALPGQRARVVEALDPDAGTGQVRLENGSLWRAVSAAPVPTGVWVLVREVSGTRLRVDDLPPQPSTKE